MMILNEGTTCKSLAEEVEMANTKEEEEEAEEEEEGEPDSISTSTVKIGDHINSKNYRISLDGCIYRGEGNANVVLALPAERKVIRFRKFSPTSKASPDGGRVRTTREIEFFKFVISGFLGDFVEPPEPLHVTHEEIIKVSETIRPLRPEYRLRKEIIEDYATIFTDYAFLPQKITALLRNDSKCRPTFCVEIKPKQGFRNEYDDQFKKCTYCLTQYNKLKTGTIKSRSRYCPFDLFSGDIDRMEKSLRNLLESPQNNLKIFKDGVIVYDFNNDPHHLENVLADWFSTEGRRTVEENFEFFLTLVSTALLREFSTSEENSLRKTKKIRGLSCLDFDPQSRINPDIVSRAKKILNFAGGACNFAKNEVPRGSILGRILDMQQLPYHSADVVYKVYSEHFATLDDEAVYSQMIRTYRRENKVSVTNGKGKKDIHEDLASSKAAKCSLNSFKSRTKISDNNGNDNRRITETVLYPVATVSSLDLQNNNNRQMVKSGGERKESIAIEELEALQNYLLVTTARDCSILVAFQEIDSTDVIDIPEKFIFEGKEGVNFVANIGVLDLDPKSIHCVEKHRQRDINVLVSLADMLEKEFGFENELPFDPV